MSDGSDFARARVLVDVGRYEDALAFAQRAVGQSPDDADAHCLLGLVLFRLGRHKEALKAAENALVQDPNSDWAHRLRALSLLRLDRNRPALAAAEQAARLTPDVSEAYAVLTEAYIANGRMRDAYRAAERCIALAPDDPTGHNAMAAVYLGSRKWRDAETSARRALAIDPEDAAARHNLGIAIANQRGRGAEGVAHLTEASKLDPRDPQSREWAVTMGRRYAAGGLLGAYLVFRFAVVALRNDEEAAVLPILAVVVIAGFVGYRLWRRKRRLAELPEGVTELIRSADRHAGRRAARLGLFSLAAVLGVLGLALATVEAVALGLTLAAAGAGIAAATALRLRGE